MPQSKSKALNDEFRKVTETYRAAKRFLEFTATPKRTLRENALEEEIGHRKKNVFNFECSLALLDADYHKILSNEIKQEKALWYVGTISRSTYYRNRQKAIEIFLNTYHRLEKL